MIRLALPKEAEAARDVSAAAYLPVYLPLYGRPPMPAREDYGPRIARGEVWVVEVDGRLAAVLVLERRADHLLLYSIAIHPAFQGQGLGLKTSGFRRCSRKASWLQRNPALHQRKNAAQPGDLRPRRLP
jgi:GNAT superfamily N-acetyltransferase